MDWHVWKMAFDMGRNYSKEIISNFIIEISQMATLKYEKNKHSPLSEASIEAETTIFVCKAILAAYLSSWSGDFSLLKSAKKLSY